MEDRKTAKRCAFTLVELLVVIGIIALLISILLPSLGAVQRQARRTQCLSNMRQLGAGLMIYVSDNGGRFPVQPSSGLVDFLAPTVLANTSVNSRSVLATLMESASGAKKMLACQMATEAPVSPTDAPTADSDTNYMLNAVVCDLKFGRVGRSSEVIMIQEDRIRFRVAWLRPSRGAVVNGGQTYTAWCLERVPQGQEYSNLHPQSQTIGEANFLYCDGHAAGRRHRDLRARDFGLTGGTGVGGNDEDPNTTSASQTYFSAFGN